MFCTTDVSIDHNKSAHHIPGVHKYIPGRMINNCNASIHVDVTATLIVDYRSFCTFPVDVLR